VHLLDALVPRLNWRRCALLLPGLLPGVVAIAQPYVIPTAVYDHAATESYSQEIQAGPSPAVTIATPDLVQFLSGTAVHLTAFHTQPGSHFEAHIVSATVPIFSTQPSNTTATTGSGVTFTIVVSGFPPPAFQWQYLPHGGSAWVNLTNGGSYSGVTTASLTVTGISATMNGDQFRCIADNGVNPAVTSTAATLSVTAPLDWQRIYSGSGTIYSWDDEDTGETNYSTDWWSFDVPGRGRLRAYSTGSTDTYGEVHAPNGDFLGSDSGNEVDANFSILADAAQAGSYQVRIGSDNDGTGDYQVYVDFFPAPAAPAATPPVALGTGGLTVGWTSVNGASSYELDVSTSSAFTSYVAAANVGNVTSFAVTGLTPNTTYYCRVRAIGTGGSSDNSATVSGMTGYNPPAVPTTTTSGIGTSGFTASWNNCDGAPTYRLDVSTSSNFTDFLPGYSDRNLGSATTCTLSGLAPNTAYYYRVRTVGSGGTSASSTTATVITLPLAPAIGAPTNVNSVGFTANWSAVAGATDYQLDVSTNSSFTSYVSGYQNRSTAGATTLAVSGLTPGTIYYYRVRAIGSSGATSLSSNTLSPAITLPSGPTLLPASAITANSFTANWSSVGWATSYRLDVSTSPDFTSFVYFCANLNVGQSTSYTVYWLDPGVSYYYRVRAVGPTGASDNSAASPAITTLLAAPVLGPLNDISATGFTVHWSSVERASGYRLDLSTSNTFATFVAGFQDLNVGSGTAFAVTGLASNVTYYYRLRAVAPTSGNSSTGQASTIDPRWQLFFSGSGTIYSWTDDNTGDTNYTEDWWPVTAPGRGAIMVFTTGATDTAGTYWGADGGYAGASSGGDAGNFMLFANMPQAGSGQIRVTSENDSVGDYQVYGYFCPAPAAPAVGEATNITYAGFTANWTAGSEAISYELDVSKDAGFTTLVWSQNAGSATSFALSGLDADTVYYYRVRTVTIGGPSLSSATISVRTAKAPVRITTAPSDTTVLVGGTATLSVVASGSPPMSYQWRRGNTNIPGATTASYTIANAQLADSDGYIVTVTNDVNSQFAGAWLTVVEPVAFTFTEQPASQTVTAGTQVSFSINGSGTWPFTLQWYKNETPISGATWAPYVIPSAQVSDTANYHVVVTNSVAAVSSNTATLTVTAVIVAPTITTPPASQTVVQGGSATFTVAASGTTPFTYQWKKGGVAISGATNASLTLSNIQAGDAGSYSVTVTNSADSATSAAASLTINSVPVTTLTASTAGASTVTGGTSIASAPILLAPLAGNNSLSQAFTVTSVTTDANGDLISQALDLSRDNGATWSAGDASTGRSWSTSPPGVSSYTLAKTFNVETNTYLFRAHGSDSAGQSSPYCYIKVRVTSGPNQQTFTTNGNFIVPDGVTSVTVFTVAGGGGGGWHNDNGGGGGGGGGGVVYSPTYTVSPGAVIPVTVGAGGQGGYNVVNTVGQPTNGGNSAFGLIMAIGGGAGGSWGHDDGWDGGSGGGATDYPNAVGGYQIDGQGVWGGAGARGNYYAAGGGGGASGAGGDGDPTTGVGGAGGPGYLFNNASYGAGGGGGTNASNAGGPAGAPGAGTGGSATIIATSGTNGRGGGGGGSGNANGPGGNGGSGVVVVSYGLPPPVVTGGTTSGTTGVAFNYQINATNSPTGYSADGLPSGLTLNASTGVISGTATVAGSTNVTITATNAAGPGNSAALTITISSTLSAPVVTGGSISGTVGMPLTDYQIQATNAPSGYSATSLPTGLTLNASTGVISGTPTVAGTTNVTVTATNAAGTSNGATLTFTIASGLAAPVITSAWAATGTVGTAFTYQISATNSPTSYNATGLPAGLNVNTTSGLISGTATAAGTSTVTITATNASGTSSGIGLTLTISAGVQNDTSNQNQLNIHLPY
jgi:hypothetical protein